MNELFVAFLIGCGFGMPVGVVIYNTMNKLHDQNWEGKMTICKNCKWFIGDENGNCGECHNTNRAWIRLVSQDNFCIDWEESQK